jgi:hypothetical protein
MTTATLAAPATAAKRSPYVDPDGFVRYEERDLAYSDRKVLEAVKMDDPEAQREHLRDVVEMYACKYGVEITVEWLLEHADMDMVYIQRMLVEDRDETARRGYKAGISWEKLKEKLCKRYGYDIFD